MNGVNHTRYGIIGLDDEQVTESLNKHGSNKITEKKPRSLISKLFENLSDPIVRILICALVANVVFNFRQINWPECFGIILAIVISTLVSTLSERGSEKAFERLKSQSSNKTCLVIRNGSEKVIPHDDIVTGDVIILSSGEAIPCDGRLIEGEVTVDQSAVNGESYEATKRCCQQSKEFSPSAPDCLFRGSLIASGSCVMRAERVGDKTMYGKIASQLSQEKRVSPLKLRLERLASTVSKIGYAAAVLVALTYMFNLIVIDSHFIPSLILAKLSDWKLVIQTLIKAITIAITVVVVAVPEGLPMMITVVLSSNIKKMLKDNVLIRKPVGIETAGSINILFTDKTGTVTSGDLTVDKIILANNKSYGNIKEIDRSEFSKIFYPSVICNSEASFADGQPVGGNSTERALLKFTGKKEGGARPISKTPFNSNNKYSCADMGSVILYKGAPEKIIPLCQYKYDENCIESEFNEKQKMLDLVNQMSLEGNRVIAMSLLIKANGICNQPRMVFLCLVKIKDKIRKEAKKAICHLKNAGIQTVMITGDSAGTAKAIAIESGIITNPDKDLILNGESLLKMSDKQLEAAIPSIKVICRALPSDKSRLVSIAQKAGLVVGMTGDGVNDAPALKMADVGFSMGSGSEIAKEASDVIILDDNLASIEKAVLYGRTIFKNIRKFILFQLTMNLCAVGVTLFGQLLGIDNPVTVIQMLWVNIIMDTLGGLAFAGEGSLERYMTEPPKKRDEPIVNGKMLGRVVIMGGYSILMCSLFLRWETMRQTLDYYTDPTKFLSAFFALFIFTGIVICFTSRSDSFFILSNIKNNKPFIIIMTFILIIQLAMIYLGGQTFRCAPLQPLHLLTVAGLSVTVVIFDLILKIIIKIFKKNKNTIEY